MPTPPPRKVIHSLDKVTDASIIHKTYRLYVAAYGMTQDLPKKDRYTLGQKIENNLLEILELLFLANSKRDAGKLPTLYEVDTKLQMMKMLIRLAYDVKAISQPRYLSLQKDLQEIGKMLGGWIKSIKG